MKIFGVIGAFIVVFGSSCLAQAGPQHEAQIKASGQKKTEFLSLYLEAIKHRAMENPSLALAVLERAGRIPDMTLEQRAALAYERGKNHSLTQDVQQAISDFQQAQEHPDFRLAALSNIDELKREQSLKIELSSGSSEGNQNSENGFIEHLNKGVLGDALSELAAIFTEESVPPETKVKAIEALLGHSQREQYMDALQRLISEPTDEDNADVAVAIAAYFLDRAEIDRAQKYAQRAVNLSNNHKKGLLILARTHYAQGDYQKGLNHAEMALAFYPASPMAYVMTARGYRYLGQLTLAEIQILAGVDFAISGSQAYRDLCLEAASIYIELDQKKEAKNWQEKAQQ